jgi:hypothetical protein
MFYLRVLSLYGIAGIGVKKRMIETQPDSFQTLSQAWLLPTLLAIRCFV